MEKRFIEYEGRRILCRTIGPEGGSANNPGDRETIVFCHADFLDGRMWDEQLQFFAENYRVISYDKIGYGESDEAQGPMCRRRELKAVFDGLGVEKAHLVGCSFGGTTAIDFALDFPSYLSSLTIVNSAPGGFEPQGEMPAILGEMIGAVQQGDLERASEFQIQIWFDGPARKATEVDGFARSKAAAMNRRFVERKTFFITGMTPLDPLDPPAISRLSEIKIPVLVGVGAIDFAETVRGSRLVADGIPGAKLVEFEKSAHVPNMDSPAEFNKELGEFLTTLRGSSGNPT